MQDQSAATATTEHATASTTAARQGETLGVMRWVLGLSLGAAVLGMAVAWLVA